MHKTPKETKASKKSKSLSVQAAERAQKRNIHQGMAQSQTNNDQSSKKPEEVKSRSRNSSSVKKRTSKAEALSSLNEEELNIVMKLITTNKWNLPQKHPDSISLRDYRKFSKLKKLSVNLSFWLLEFYSTVISAGGIVLSISRNFFTQLVTGFRERHNLPQNNAYSYFLLYKQYLLAYELQNSYDIKALQIFDLGYVSYYDIASYQAQRQQGKIPKDIFVIENFNDACGMDLNILNTHFMREKYGQSEIQIRKQNPNAFGFNTRSLSTQKGKMLLSEYIDYQHQYVDFVEEGKYKKKNSNDKVIKFAVNIDTQDKPEILNQIKKGIIKFKEFQFTGSLDGLSYLDAEIEGCSLPQMYLKVKGCWTGGHQQNTALSSVNINHGPGESEWLTLDYKYLPRLRYQILKEFKRDIFANEGLWYEEIIWFIKNNYPIKKIVQKKGDLVYSGPGTMHWVRALSSCVQSAWNIMPKGQQQFKPSRYRQIVNQEIKFELVIPFKTLLLKILNHQYHVNSSTKIIEQYILTWIEEEELTLGLYQHFTKNSKINLMNIPDSVTSCYKCHVEIFLYFIYSSEKIYCLNCAQLQKFKEQNIQSKYEKSKLCQLLHRSRTFRSTKFLEKIPEVTQLCNGQFIGEISYCEVSKSHGLQKFVKDQNIVQKVTNIDKMPPAQIKEETKSQKPNNADIVKKQHDPDKSNSRKSKTRHDQKLLQITQKTTQGRAEDNKAQERSQSRSRSRKKNASSWSTEFQQQGKGSKAQIKYPRKAVVSPTNQEPANGDMPQKPVNEPQQNRTEQLSAFQQGAQSKVLYPKRKLSKPIISIGLSNLAQQASEYYHNKQKQSTQQIIAENRNALMTLPPPPEPQTIEEIPQAKNVKYPRKNTGGPSTGHTAIEKCITPSIKYSKRSEKKSNCE